MPNGRQLVDFSAEIRLWYENFRYAELRSFLACVRLKVELGRIVGYSYLVCNSYIRLFCLIWPGIALGCRPCGAEKYLYYYVVYLTLDWLAASGGAGVLNASAFSRI